MADRLMKFYVIEEEEGSDDFFFNTKRSAVIAARNRCFDYEEEQHVFRVFVPFPKKRADIVQFMNGHWCRKREDVAIFEWNRDEDKVEQVWHEDTHDEPYDTWKHHVHHKGDQY